MNKLLLGKEKFTVSFVYADKGLELNTSVWRCIIPARALSKVGYGVSLVPVELFQQNTPEAEEACNSSDIIIVERNLFGDTLTRMIFWIARGKVVLVNYDDDYAGIEATNMSYEYWHDGTITATNEETKEEKKLYVFPHPMWQYKLGLKLAHAQLVSSKQFIKKYKKYSPVYYLPNYFETQYYINFEKEKRDHIVIGWGGSLSHLQSFKDSGVLGALKLICEQKPNVKVLICGDPRVFEAMDLPEDKKLFQEYVQYEQWGSVIAQKFDIGIAPLAGEYDQYRSWIKPIEFMLTKTPFVASKGRAYQDIAEYCNLVDNTENAWFTRLSEMIDNLEQENVLIAGKPFNFALEQDVDKRVFDIAKLLEDISFRHAHIQFRKNRRKKITK